MKIHSNITNHTTRYGPAHKFRLVDASIMVPPIQSPDPYTPSQGEEIICSSCRSRVHTEFFRCLNCPTLFDLVSGFVCGLHYILKPK